MHCLIDANVEHGESLSRATDDQRPFAAQLLSSDHKANRSDNDLDNAVDSCCEETGGSSRETYALEDLRRVVVDAAVC